MDKLAAWTSEHTTDEVLEVMEKVSVPAGKIYDAQDIVQDEHINARGMIENVTIGTKEDGRGWNLKVNSNMTYFIFSSLYRSLACHLFSAQHLDLLNGPVRIYALLGKKHSFFLGPDLGAHTNQVLKDLLGLTESDIVKLEQDGIIKPK